MENKINIAELLKDCPNGMELDCTMFDDVTFEGIKQDEYPIIVKIKEPSMPLSLTKTGCWNLYNSAKCIIFPKGKTTWEGFQRPFKDGDIVATQNGIWIGIHKRMVGNAHEVYFAINHDCLIYNDNIFCFERLATEDEKQKLFDAIKENGYKWNPESKALEKLVEPKFKVGDIIQDIDSYKVKITAVDIEDECYGYECYGYESMFAKGIGSISFSEQDNWELVPSKFDINDLKPFDKVLARLTKDGVWNATFFSHYDKEVKWGCYPFITTSSKSYPMCIPYNEDTKYLLGTTNDCDEFYKTW